MSDEASRPSGSALHQALERARLGDRAAFAELYDSLGHDVERLCMRLLGSRADAEDAKSEVFVRAQEGFASYDDRQPLRRWLLAVAAHHCIDLLRRRALEGRLFASSDLDPGRLPALGPTPLRAALDAEARERLRDAIDALPAKYRAPLVLRYFAELPYEAIARTLDVSPAQVGTLLFRARARLRERLAAEGGRP